MGPISWHHEDLVIRSLSKSPETRARCVKDKATRGLGISESPTSDNLTPQETTKQATGEVGTDGLVCPVLVAAW
jgi:hypothetical protein